MNINLYNDMIYTYPFISGDIVIMALKIEQGGLIVPDGMSSNGTDVEVVYLTPLSDSDKAILDSIMTNTNLGIISSSTNSIYTWDDIMDFRAQINNALSTFGISFVIYPFGKSQYKIIFNKVLTATDKTNVRNTIISLFKQIQ